MKDSRRIGQQFMADQCRVLAAWWFGIDPTVPAYELPVRPKSTIMASLEGWRRKGDVVVSPTHDSRWPFSVEFKKDEGWAELEGLWQAPKYPLMRWWDQCRRQAEQSDSAHPLLIFTRNRRKVYSLAKATTTEWLRLKARAGPVARIERPDEEPLVLALLDDLTATTPPRSSRAVGSRRRLRRRSRA